MLDSDIISDTEKARYISFLEHPNEQDISYTLNDLSDYLSRYYGKDVIILLDEYDTPMQEAYVSGYWEELAAFTRSLFNSTFKTNPYLERAIMTGITRVSKESIFSDLNNLKVVTVTSDEYSDCCLCDGSHHFLCQYVLVDIRQYVVQGYFELLSYPF